jgi:hypothetical protein
MGGKFFPVPGAGGAGYAQPPAFRFRSGKTPGQIPGMYMGVAGHKTSPYYYKYSAWRLLLDAAFSVIVYSKS